MHIVYVEEKKLMLIYKKSYKMYIDITLYRSMISQFFFIFGHFSPWRLYAIKISQNWWGKVNELLDYKNNAWI